LNICLSVGQDNLLSREIKLLGREVHENELPAFDFERRCRYEQGGEQETPAFGYDFLPARWHLISR
jgi:hypothetical protein